MKTIIVDDEAIMIKSFLRQGADVDGLNVVGQFQYPEDAIAYAQNNPVNLAVLDISLPGMDGIELARRLKAFHPDILIVFITAYEEYIREANRIGADYYIVKPYTREMLVSMMNKMKLLSRGQRKEVYIQMFGRFVVMHRNNPVQLSGKAKEILALIATRQGKEISNEEIYCTLWENRGYSNDLMKVYYNALRRLKDKLAEQSLSNLLISTPHGQMLNTEIVDCDYFAWKAKDLHDSDRFEGSFLPEYSWGEVFLADILNENW